MANASKTESGPVHAGSMPCITLLVHEAEEGGFWGEVYGLPGCVSQGETVDELRRNILEAMEAVLPYSEAGHPTTTMIGSPQTYPVTLGTA